jgi:hypothetical protein
MLLIITSLTVIGDSLNYKHIKDNIINLSDNQNELYKLNINYNESRITSI